MDESPEKQVLKTLTLCTVKALSKIEKLLNEAPDKKRDKKILRIIKEHEVCNDESMRVGLNLGAQQIAGLKMGRGYGSSRPQKPDNSAPRVQSPFSQLMEHHAKQFVDRKVPNAPAQGKAISEILKKVTPEVAINCYNSQLEETWRQGRVSWLTVQHDVARMNGNGIRPLDASERNAARSTENFEFIADLRGGSGPDYH